jgi:glycosyltransferase involved in cell wall biosynthesis
MIKILYFSGYEWGNLGRRKTRLAYEFARQPEVASVLYVEPAVSTSLLDLARGRLAASHLEQERRAHLEALLGRPRLVDKNVWVYTGSDKSLPLTRLDALRRWGKLQQINQTIYAQNIRRLLHKLPGEEVLLWLTHPLQVWALDAFPERALACYDWTDDWAAFNVLPVEDPRTLIAANQRTIRGVDQVFAVSEDLTRRAASLNPHTDRAPNASDPQRLGDAEAAAPELEQMSRPIVGYIGQIADKVDYALIGEISQARPNWSFVFVGPVWYTRQALVDSLGARPNVHFLGARPYESLSAYLREFDVCIMPHVRNALTRSMDPTKLYDYMVTGKPIVSTEVAGLERFPDVVYTGNTSQAFLSALDRAIAENGRWRQRRLAYARANTWPHRADEIWAAVKGRLAEGGLK